MCPVQLLKLFVMSQQWVSVGQKPLTALSLALFLSFSSSLCLGLVAYVCVCVCRCVHVCVCCVWRWRRYLQYAWKELPSSVPPGCRRVCPSVVLALSIWSTSCSGWFAAGSQCSWWCLHWIGTCHTITCHTVILVWWDMRQRWYQFGETVSA